MKRPFSEKALPKNKIFFLFFAAITALMTITFMIIFFVLPNNPISDYSKVAALPVKYLGLILIGGLSKDFLLGYFTCYYYIAWQKEKTK